MCIEDIRAAVNALAAQMKTGKWRNGEMEKWEKG